MPAGASQHNDQVEMKKYLTELIGTFFLVLTIGLVVADGTPLGAIAIGAILMVMVYLGGHISGAHYNPAVTLAVLMRGAMPKGDIVPYLIAQVIGAIAAALVSLWIVGETFAPAPAGDATVVGTLLVEFFFTFALALVVLNVAVAEETKGNSYYGLAIGFTILAAALAGGPISGGAFNPAVGLGPIIVNGLAGDGSFSNLWLYLVGPFAGGALGAIVFAMQHEKG